MNVVSATRSALRPLKDLVQSPILLGRARLALPLKDLLESSPPTLLGRWCHPNFYGQSCNEAVLLRKIDLANMDNSFVPRTAREPRAPRPRAPRETDARYDGDAWMRPFFE